MTKLCKYGNESATCTLDPMDCQCAIDAALEDDEYEDCSWCHGCGDGDYDGATCRKCHGSGIEPSERNEDDDYDNYEGCDD
jgi:DnaJ-class molecular chaperone